MKKIIVFSFLLALAASVFCIGAYAAESFDISISDVLAENGYSEVTLTVTNNPGVAFFSATLRYDTDALVLDSVQNGSVIIDLDTGINLVWSEDQDSTLTGILAKLKFRIKEGASGKYTVDLIARECYAMNEDVSAVVSSGSITVSTPHIHTDADGKWETDGISHWHTCACGEITDKVEHSGGNGTCTVKPKCEICFVEYGDVWPSVHTVSLNKIAEERLLVQGSGLDCQSYKQYYYECILCHRPTSEKWHDTSVGEHKFSSLIPAQKEVHTENELKAGIAAHYKCTVCLSFFTDKKEPTDIAALTGKTPAHSFGGYLFDDTGHRKICFCGKSDMSGNHIYDSDADMVCDVCSYDRSCKHPGGLIHIPYNPASCTVSGNLEYWYCKDCGRIFDRSDPASAVELTYILIPAFGHLFDRKIDDADHLRSAAENCSEHNSYWYACSVCGAISDEYFFESDESGAHIVVTVQGYPKTCENDGLTDSVFCVVCGLYIQEPIVMWATGHRFGEWVILRHPGAGEQGSKVRKCNDCGVEQTEIIPSLPEETTATQEETTEVREETTDFVESTTAYVEETTVLVEETTVIVDETTVFVEETTVFVEDTTVIRDDTTEGSPETSDMAEYTTECIEEVTIPEVLPPTGDSSPFLIIAIIFIIAIIATFFAFRKKKNQ